MACQHHHSWPASSSYWKLPGVLGALLLRDFVYVPSTHCPVSLEVPFPLPSPVLLLQDPASNHPFCEAADPLSQATRMWETSVFQGGWTFPSAPGLSSHLYTSECVSSDWLVSPSHCSLSLLKYFQVLPFQSPCKKVLKYLPNDSMDKVFWAPNGTREIAFRPRGLGLWLGNSL